MLGSGVTAHLPGHLGRHHLGLGGHQGLTHLARLLVALLLGHWIVCSDWDCLARLNEEFLSVSFVDTLNQTDLRGNIDTFLTFHFDRDWDALLLWDIFTELFAYK